MQKKHLISSFFFLEIISETKKFFHIPKHNDWVVPFQVDPWISACLNAVLGPKCVQNRGKNSFPGAQALSRTKLLKSQTRQGYEISMKNIAMLFFSKNAIFSSIPLSLLVFCCFKGRDLRTARSVLLPCSILCTSFLFLRVPFPCVFPWLTCDFVYGKSSGEVCLPQTKNIF